MTALVKIRAVLAMTGILLNTCLLILPLYVLALLRLLLPVRAVQVHLARFLVWIAEAWMANNNTIIGLCSGVRWDVEGMEGLKRRQWYLVTANHQSWADILVLQKVTNRRIPSLKFFLKQELVWVPLLGLAWWALDFPFMKRYSRAHLEKRPELRGKDMETTRKACEKYAHYPVSVMNFFEGTRFSRAKHDEQASPYVHLLKPRAGGAAFTLDAMAGKLKCLLDFTIIYPDGVKPSLLAFLGGGMKRVRVIVHQRPIPAWTAEGDYQNDPEFRRRLQAWISEIWAEKDALMHAEAAV